MEILDMAGHLIRRLHQNSTQVFQLQAKEAGIDLTPVQFAALDAINSHPGIDQATIAAKIAYDRATIGGVIDRLEHKGYVIRVVSKRDRRAREVRLSDKGSKVLAAALPIIRAVQADILPGLSDDEKSKFLALARQATDAIESG